MAGRGTARAGRAAWRMATAVVAAAGWASVAWASDGPALSPREALWALPSPPAKVDEARARWAGGVDRAVEPVREGARTRLAEARRELGRQEPFDRNPEDRRAAAGRLAPGEVSALLALEQAHAAEPVELSRNIETLARSRRQAIEDRAEAIEEARQAALAACRDRPCEKAAALEAKKARAELLAKLLEETTKRWEVLRLRLDHFLNERQKLAERVATATSDPYVRLQAQGLLTDTWKAVAALADEVEQETQLAAKLAE